MSLWWEQSSQRETKAGPSYCRQCWRGRGLGCDVIGSVLKGPVPADSAGGGGACAVMSSAPSWKGLFVGRDQLFLWIVSQPPAPWKTQHCPQTASFNSSLCYFRENYPCGWLVPHRTEKTRRTGAGAGGNGASYSGKLLEEPRSSGCLCFLTSSSRYTWHKLLKQTLWMVFVCFQSLFEQNDDIVCELDPFL